VTAGELIAMLSTFPPDTRIVVARDEGGYDDACECEKTTIALSVHKKIYLGKHDTLDSFWLPDDFNASDHEIIDAICIS
jgi:hypothetical protein